MTEEMAKNHLGHFDEVTPTAKRCRTWAKSPFCSRGSLKAELIREVVEWANFAKDVVRLAARRRSPLIPQAM